MAVEDLEKEIPGLIEYTETMPEEIRKNLSFRSFIHSPPILRALL